MDRARRAIGCAAVGLRRVVCYWLQRVGEGENSQMRDFRQPSETFGPFDPGAPRVQPDVSTPALRAAVAVEDAIRRDSQETGVFISPDGRELLRRTGAPDRVSFTADELRAVRGATFTHNHPGGAPFSVDDVELGAFAKLFELRAVTSGQRFVAQGLDVVWEGAIRSAFERFLPQAIEDALNESRREGIRAKDVARLAQHLAWVRTARQLGFRYFMELS